MTVCPVPDGFVEMERRKPEDASHLSNGPLLTVGNSAAERDSINYSIEKRITDWHLRSFCSKVHGQAKSRGVSTDNVTEQDLASLYTMAMAAHELEHLLGPASDLRLDRHHALSRLRKSTNISWAFGPATNFVNTIVGPSSGGTQIASPRAFSKARRHYLARLGGYQDDDECAQVDKYLRHDLLDPSLNASCDSLRPFLSGFLLTPNPILDDDEWQMVGDSDQED